MENSLVKIDPQEYGLDESKAEQVKAVFMPMIQKMEELEKEYKEVVTLPVDRDTCAKAKELRLKYVKVRTGTAAIHKEAKDFYLKGGKFVDAWKNTQLFISQGIEEKLAGIETHFERLEAEKKAALQAERMDQYRPYMAPGMEVMAEPDLSSLPDDIWANMLAGAKAAHEARIAAEKKADEDRIAKEKAEAEAKAAKEKKEAAEKERIKKENARLKAEADKKEKERKQLEEEKIELQKNRMNQYKKFSLLPAGTPDPDLTLMSNSDWFKFLNNAEKTFRAVQEAKLKAEQDRLAKEDADAKEKDRLDDENKRLKEESDKKLAEAKAEKEKLEAELKAKEEAEEKAQKEKEAAEKKARTAPDKEKIKIFAQRITDLILPDVKSKEARDLITRAGKALVNYAAKLKSEADNL
jgi:hypothetical protein